MVGTAEVFAKPDRATVRLGVQADDNNAADAQSEVNKIMDQILEALAKKRITRPMIQTSAIRLHPIYGEHDQRRLPTAQRKVTGFRAEHTLEVTLTDLGRVGEILDAGTAAGANRIESVSFELKNDLEPRLSALRMALKDARAKSRAIADELGVEIKSVYQVSEDGTGVIPFGSEIMSFDRAQAPTSIEPGRMKITASVTVRFELSAGDADQGPALNEE